MINFSMKRHKTLAKNTLSIAVIGAMGLTMAACQGGSGGSTGHSGGLLSLQSSINQPAIEAANIGAAQNQQSANETAAVTATVSGFPTNSQGTYPLTISSQDAHLTFNHQTCTASARNDYSCQFTVSSQDGNLGQQQIIVSDAKANISKSVNVDVIAPHAKVIMAKNSPDGKVMALLNAHANGSNKLPELFYTMNDWNTHQTSTTAVPAGAATVAGMYTVQNGASIITYNNSQQQTLPEVTYIQADGKAALLAPPKGYQSGKLLTIKVETTFNGNGILIAYNNTSLKPVAYLLNTHSNQKYSFAFAGDSVIQQGAVSAAGNAVIGLENSTSASVDTLSAQGKQEAIQAPEHATGVARITMSASGDALVQYHNTTAVQLVKTNGNYSNLGGYGKANEALISPNGAVLITDKTDIGGVFYSSPSAPPQLISFPSISGKTYMSLQHNYFIVTDAHDAKATFISSMGSQQLIDAPANATKVNQVVMKPNGHYLITYQGSPYISKGNKNGPFFALIAIGLPNNDIFGKIASLGQTHFVYNIDNNHQQVVGYRLDDQNILLSAGVINFTDLTSSTGQLILNDQQDGVENNQVSLDDGQNLTSIEQML